MDAEDENKDSVDPTKKFELDEHGVKSDGQMLESPLEALDPGFIDFARLQAGTCFGREMMETCKP